MNDNLEYFEEVKGRYVEPNTTHVKGYTKEYVDKLQSNWNSLREWLEEQNKFYEVSTMGYSYGVICNVLDKMNELEGNKDG